ncbi:MAG: hypothetical protein KF690_09370 [Bacteroidetes bacterium]|nr:hypothetical protein [Bacteroidota bacterium]
MYFYFLQIHSLLRWGVLLSLVFAVCWAYRGLWKDRKFTAFSNRVRHWTATLAHVQLVVGFTLYFESPTVRYFWGHLREAVQDTEMLFFGGIHMLLMFVSVTCISLGSAFAKRQATDRSRYKTLLIWYAIGLLLLLIAIPWPFSPLAGRPYVRLF